LIHFFKIDNRTQEDIERQSKEQADFEMNILSNAAAEILVGSEVPADWRNWRDYTGQNLPTPDTEVLIKRIEHQFTRWFSEDGRLGGTYFAYPIPFLFR